MIGVGGGGDDGQLCYRIEKPSEINPRLGRLLLFAFRMDVNVHAQSLSPLKRTRLAEPTLVGFRRLARRVHARAMILIENQKTFQD